MNINKSYKPLIKTYTKSYEQQQLYIYIEREREREIV